MTETQRWARTNKGGIKFDVVVSLGKYSYAKASALDDCFPDQDENDGIKSFSKKE